MTHNIEFSNAPSDAIVAALATRLNEIRLSQNISQADVAREAGVSRSTLTRLADGQPVSLDSFVRIMLALGLADHLAALLPDPGVRPVDRVRLSGAERQRASRKSPPKEDWAWGDGDEPE